MRRIFGGDNPELLDRLQPVLDKFGTDLDAKVKAGTSDLLTKAAKQFDPSDPTSPMAKHTAELEAQQQKLTALIDDNHKDLAKKVDELATALKVQEAKTSLAKVTPIKGDTFENQVNAVLAAIAAGLGDEYTDTRATVGEVPRSKKGDGLLTVDGGAARVVIEMTDSPRDKWTEYFDEAERNRHAGCVARAGPDSGAERRAVHPRPRPAADRARVRPLIDDPELVRTVVMLLRTSALAASRAQGLTPDRHRRGEDHRGDGPAREARRGEEGRRLDPEERDEDRKHVHRHQLRHPPAASDALAALTDADAASPDSPPAGAVANAGPFTDPQLSDPSV